MAARCGGRRMRRDSLHLTLVFIGEVTPAQIDRIRQVAGSVRGEPVALELDRLGYWPEKRLAWLGCTRVPASLISLQTRLVEGMASAGLTMDERRYFPHVTLVRNVRNADLPESLSPVNWKATGFALVESQLNPAGAHYQELGRWSLEKAG